MAEIRHVLTLTISGAAGAQLPNSTQKSTGLKTMLIQCAWTIRRLSGSLFLV